ncbi:Heavy-metal-associated domain [Parelaphostrongylus tenuis]|uniref:Heavy-metal-associated domain n=1 Tax=Parelaphostrongylus tenuis TaxID=148309 RepID=A0AAD5M4U7_PARTN|nr:Heavy-metal-associated domain [Parelaphostrongylus tenuis]
MTSGYEGNRCLLDDSLLESRVSSASNTSIPPYPSISQESNGKLEEGDGKTPLEAAVISIRGMTCHSCVNTIQDAMRSRPGIRSCTVSLEKAEGTVVFDPSIWNGTSVAESIDDLGFEAKFKHSNKVSENEVPVMSSTYRKRATISIKGMVCKACVDNIQDTTMKRPGVLSVIVSLEKEEGTIVYDPTIITDVQLVEGVNDMGFEAKLLRTEAVLDSVALSESIQAKNPLIRFTTPDKVEVSDASFQTKSRDRQ